MIWIVPKTVSSMIKTMIMLAFMVEGKFTLSERYELCHTLVENLVAEYLLMN